jgi:MFS family permease
MGGPIADETTPLLRPGVSDNIVADVPNSGSGSNGHVGAVPAVTDSGEYAGQLNLVKVPSTSTGVDIEPGLDRVSSVATVPANGSTVGDSAQSTYADRFVHVTPRRFWLVFGGILLGYMLGFFDSTFMSSSHPVITSHFHASNSASWLSTAFLLTSTALLPLFGRVSDTFGRKPVYVFAIAVFFVTTAWCALAQSIGSFIAARALSGLGAGGVFSMGMILCSDIVRLEYRGIYQSYINIALGVGGALGFAGGGLLCDHLGWRGAFGVQLPFIFAYLLLAIWTTPDDLGLVATRKEDAGVRDLIRQIDIAGSCLLTVGIAALIIGINLGGNVLSWDHPLVISSLVVALLLAGVFPWYESKVDKPVMPVELLTQSPHAYIIFGNFFGSMSIHTVMFNIPLFFQAVKLESATASGLHLLSATFAITCSSVLTGFLITWSGRLQPFLILGGALFVLGGVTTMLLTLLDLPYIVTLIFVSLSSLAQGFSFPTFTIAILAVNKQEAQAACVTTLGLWRNLGSVLGVAISSCILQSTLRVRLEETVTGPHKEEIILLVRKSVDAVANLDPVHQVEGMFSVLLVFLAACRCLSCRELEEILTIP